MKSGNRHLAVGNMRGTADALPFEKNKWRGEAQIERKRGQMEKEMQAQIGRKIDQQKEKLATRALLTCRTKHV